jgi:hypothetical protein
LPDGIFIISHPSVIAEYSRGAVYPSLPSFWLCCHALVNKQYDEAQHSVSLSYSVKMGQLATLEKFSH